MSDKRGQAFTLEGVIGAMILLTAVLFALNSAVLLPSTGETGNQAQIEQEAKDVMQIAADEGHLTQMARCYNTTEEEWFGQEGTATAPPNDTELQTLLDDTFGDRDRSYNLEIKYATDTSTERVTYQGASTRNGVTVSRTVTLYEDEPLLRESGSGTSCADPEEELNTLSDDGDNYPVTRGATSNDYIYNVVEVRLTIR
ncbi:hypothetical protein ACFQH2_12540 [Natronoarchaeum sp. GCM10025703]|uniref:DUF7288 family protein n=1 Tax=unclassified Natronoarchaeum TaxID=2620183 RepID=UPI00361302FD